VTFEEGTWSAWLYDLLHSRVDKLVVCNPRKKRMLVKVGLCLAIERASCWGRAGHATSSFVHPIIFAKVLWFRATLRVLAVK
jgi:hypothetical protein